MPQSALESSVTEMLMHSNTPSRKGGSLAPMVTAPAVMYGWRILSARLGALGGANKR